MGPGHTAIFFRLDSLIRSLAAPSTRTNCFTSNCAWWEIICPGEDAAAAVAAAGGGGGGGEPPLFRQEGGESDRSVTIFT